jgi:PAS domain S-box-containing protein
MGTIWKPLAIFVALLALFTYFLFQARSPDLGLRARMHDALQTVQLRDAELTRDVLLARAGLLPSYDPLVETSQRLARALHTLRAESATVSDAQPELERHTEALADALQAKLKLVEYFKSDNALLRNSLAYFTHAGQTVGTRIEAEKSVATEVTGLSGAMLRFLQTPEGGARKEAEAALQRLSSMASSNPGLDSLVAHGQLIVGELPEVDASLRQIIETPTAAHADALQGAVLAYSDRAERRAQAFRFLLYLVAVLLLNYVVYQFARLRTSAVNLRRANMDLQREMGERQQAVAALQVSEERFRAITESANDAIISADSAGHIVSWNARAEAIFGYPAQEVLGTPLSRLVPDRYRAAHTAGFAQWSATGASRLVGATVEFTGLREDGSEFPIELSLSTWSAREGRHVTAIVRDLTARKRLEHTTRQQELQLIQANKMTAVGTLVSGVAHELNNPNQLVLMNANMLADAWRDAGEILNAHRRENGEFSLGGLTYTEMRTAIPGLINEIRDSALRIGRIIDDLKHFARPPAGERQTVFCLNDAVQRALRLLAHLIKQRTDHFRADVAQAWLPVRGDPQQVEQIVVNLLVNALEALPDRHRGVTVTTRFDAASARAIVEVCDEGVGIPPEHLAHLSDPFFTTKQASGGTGLGLAITSSLVRVHGGELSFASEPGKGTRARVELPAVLEQPSPA